jgi:hypothetical protein
MNTSNYNLPDIESNVNSYIGNKEQQKPKQYSGFFQDSAGRPDFKGLGPILKGVLYLFLFSIIISIPETNYYFAALLFLFFIGRVLTAIRFYYIETLDLVGNDSYFVQMNMVQNVVEGFVALFVVLYILFGSVFTKKNIASKR